MSEDEISVRRLNQLHAYYFTQREFEELVACASKGGWKSSEVPMSIDEFNEALVPTIREAEDYLEAIGQTTIPGPSECPIAQSVSEDIIRRSQHGLLKYGVTLARTDLSRKEWAQHAYEEALDFACYLKRLMQEFDNETES